MKNNLFTFAMLALLALGLSLTSCGPSKATLAIQSAATIEEVQGLANKLIWLQANKQSNGTYVIELDSDENIKDGNFLQAGAKDNITIILRGIGANRTITSTGSSMFSMSDMSAMFPVFTVFSSVTLVLDDNITLKGRIHVNGGTLIMNNGSVVSGNKADGYGGGILVSSGGGRMTDGVFIMNGGTISGNTSSRQMTVSGVKGSTDVYRHYVKMDSNIGGGGVYMTSGIFTKTGGTITDNSVMDIKKELMRYGRNCENRNNCIEFDSPRGTDIYEATLGFGSQIGFNCNESRGIDAPIGAEMNIQVSVKDGRCTFSDIQNETPKQVEPVTEDKTPAANEAAGE